MVLTALAGAAVVAHRHSGVDVGATVVASIVPAPPAPPPTPAPVSVAPPAKAVLSETDLDAQSGVTIVRPPGSPTATGLFIKVPQDLSVTLQPAPDPRLVEPSRFGPLPRRGSDGTRPLDVYGRPVVLDATLPADAPKIALLVGGMGLDATATAAAAADLPPAVSFGFAPYGETLDRQVRMSRDAGHEIILQVPMEGFGDPSSSAMSHLLMTNLDGKENLDRLHWLMARFTGYVGVANFLGGKFTADAGAFEPVLRDVAGRGLLYVDDSTAARSLGADLAAKAGAPLLRADIVIDAASDPAAVDAALKALEARARQKGVALGFASGVPAARSAVARFAKDLSNRGIALVPVSALSDSAHDGRLVARP